MARKKTEKKDMTTAAEPVLKPVRLDLSPEVHRMLRKVAADDDVSMASYARDAIKRLFREEIKRRGIKL